MSQESELYTVEFDNGEMLDCTGDGGFSVFTSRAEAQDALDSEESSLDRFSEGVTLSVVKWTRSPDALQS